MIDKLHFTAECTVMKPVARNDKKIVISFIARKERNFTQNVEKGIGTRSISEGDCIHFLPEGFTDRLYQPENANFWRLGGKELLDQLAWNSNLQDDATGICFRIKAKIQ